MDAPRPHVVLLHGFTGTPRIWDAVVADLTRDHEVHALPIAGHRGGRPVRRGEALPIKYLVDELESEWEDLGRPHIVGNSMGGWLALELAARGRARTVYALCPAGFWKGAEDPDFARIRKIFVRADAATRRTRHVASTALRIPLVRRVAFREVARRADRLSHAAAVEAVLGARECSAYPGVLDAGGDGAGTYDQLSCPVAVRMAEHDRAFPPAAYLPEIERRIPGADIAVLADVGHIPMIDDPELVASDIRAWVARFEED